MRPIRALASTWLAAALLATVLSGCGGSSKSSTTSGGAASSGGSSSTSSSTSTNGVPAGTSPAGVAAITACKQAIQAQTSLPATAKAKLESVCAKAASGDQAAVRKAAQEVCEEVINKSAVPAGPAKEHALQTCRK